MCCSGLLLVLLGVLVYLYPRILVSLLSGFLVVSGLGLMVLHWRLRRIYRAWDQATSRLSPLHHPFLKALFA